jgi:putative endonuclease
MYFVYVLYNQEHAKIYIGQTDNIEKRLEQHNQKTFGGYTARFSGVWVLIYSEEVVSRNEALKREKQLKSYQGRKFVKKFILSASWWISGRTEKTISK